MWHPFFRMIPRLINFCEGAGMLLVRKKDYRYNRKGKNGLPSRGRAVFPYNLRKAEGENYAGSAGADETVWEAEGGG